MYFPRTANLILKKHIIHDGLTVADEEYVPLGGTDFSAIVNKIAAAKPDVTSNHVTSVTSNPAKKNCLRRFISSGLDAK